MTLSYTDDLVNQWVSFLEKRLRISITRLHDHDGVSITRNDNMAGEDHHEREPTPVTIPNEPVPGVVTGQYVIAGTDMNDSGDCHKLEPVAEMR